MNLFFQSVNQAEIKREPQYLFDRIISKQEKGLQQLKAYLKVRIRLNEFEQIQKIIDYFISKNSHVNNISIKILLICSFEIIIKTIENEDSLKSLVSQIISSILIYFVDPYEKVRLQAISSVYNIMNFLYNSCLKLFIKIFTYLLHLVPDQNPEIKTAVSFLNHTLKILVNDAILNHQYFDINEFMSILIQNFITESPAVKQFIIDWFISIDLITQIQVTFYLPLVFKELFKLICLEGTTVKDKSEQCLRNFLYGFKQLLRNRTNIQKKIKQDSFSMLCGVLIEVIKQSLELQVKYHALEWMEVFCQLFYNQIQSNDKIQTKNTNFTKSQIWLKDIKQNSKSFTQSLSYLGLIKQDVNQQLDQSIAGSVALQSQQTKYLIDIFLGYFKDFILLALHSFSDDNQKIRKITKRINEILMNCYLIIQEKTKPDNSIMRQHPVQFHEENQNFIQKLEVPLITKLAKFLKESKSAAKIEAIMRWIKIIYSNSQNPQIYIEINSLIHRIVQKICDKNAQKELFQLVIDSVFMDRYLNLFIQTLLSYLYQNQQIDPQKILIQVISTKRKYYKKNNSQYAEITYVTILQRLVSFQAEKDKFKQRMIQNLISILITQQSLTVLRKKIRIYKNQYSKTKTSQIQEKQILNLVKKLFEYFCVNQGFLILFCFLTGMYHMVNKILNNLAVESGLTRQKIKSFIKASYLIQSPNMDHFKLDMFHLFPAMKAYLGFIMVIPAGKLNKALLDRIPEQIQFDFEQQNITQKEKQLQNELFDVYLCIQQKVKQEIRLLENYQKQKTREREESSISLRHQQVDKKVKSIEKQRKKTNPTLMGVKSEKRLFKKLSIKFDDQFRQKEK